MATNPTRKSTRATAGISNRFSPPVAQPTKKTSRPKTSAAIKKGQASKKASVKQTSKKKVATGNKRKAEESDDDSDDEDSPQPAKVAKKQKVSHKVTGGTKRKADESDSESDAQDKSKKRQKTAKAAAAPPKMSRIAKKKAPKPKAVKPKVVINQAPTQRLDIYMAGEGGQGELGLGVGAGKTSALKPKLNTELPSVSVGVVQVAAGGMHCVALTHDSKVMTWGVNDEGALGRDTKWDGKLVDADADESGSGSECADQNPREATPAAVEFPPSAKDAIFTQVVAGDSTSFALTDDGQVYGWGTFRVCHFSYDRCKLAVTDFFPGQRRHPRFLANNHDPAHTRAHPWTRQGGQASQRSKPCRGSLQQGRSVCVGRWPATPAGAKNCSKIQAQRIDPPRIRPPQRHC